MSSSLFDRAKEIIPGGVNSPVRFYEPYPFFASYGKGSKIITEDHDTLIDYCLGYGSIILGHAYFEVLSAVKKQLEKGNIFDMRWLLCRFLVLEFQKLKKSLLLDHTTLEHF